MYRTIRVPIEKGEEARLEVLTAGLLDDTRKIRKVQTVEGAFLEIPVTETAGKKVGDFPVTEQENPYFLEKPSSLNRYLKDFLSEAELACIPSGWQILGDIIIVGIPEVLDDKKIKIAEALLAMHPKCRAVVRDFGIEGQFRLPIRELLLGDGTETIHKEHGCFFK